MLDHAASTASAFTLVSPLLSYSLDILPVTVNPTFSDPTMEAELFTDMAHVVLDCATFFGPATPVMPLLSVVGRLLSIGADLLPDRAMTIEEAIFQAIMFFVAANNCIKAYLPTLLATTVDTSFRDSRVFHKTFSAAGVSWIQYKTMAAVAALEWIEVEGGHIISSEESSPDSDYFYYLYRGTASIHSQGGGEEGFFLAAAQVVDTPIFLGEMLFTGQMDGVDVDETSPKVTIKAGDQGATLLRIQSSKLISLMKNDGKLAKSIRSLIVKSIQGKLLTAMRGKLEIASNDAFY
jgi:hypothetical protein